MTQKQHDDIRNNVRDSYAEVAEANNNGESCGVGSSCCGVPDGVVSLNSTRMGYSEDDINGVPDGAGGIVEQSVRIPVWFEPVADGGTPMCQAAGEAKRIIEGWIAEHPDSFPPIVIHITDGESTDGNPTSRLRCQGSSGPCRAAGRRCRA